MCAHTRNAPPKQMEEPNIFSGLAYCADCKRTMVLHRASTMKRSDYNFKCYTYVKRGKGECTPHHIREDELYAIILDDLRRVTHFARKKEQKFAEYINRKTQRSSGRISRLCNWKSKPCVNAETN